MDAVFLGKDLTTIVRDLPPPRTLREYVLEQMSRIDLAPAREHGLRGDY